MLDFLRIIDVEADRTSPTAKDSIKNAVRFLKDTKYRYFYAAVNDVKEFLEEAYIQGIAGTGDHNWLFTAYSGDINDDTEYERGSPMHLVLRGVSQLAPVGAFVAGGNERYLRLIQEFQSLRKSKRDREYVRAKLPQYEDAPDFFNLEEPDFFDLAWGGNAASGPEVFLYDTIISAGLSACNITREGTYFDGPGHYRAILDNEFYGTSGHVRLDRKTGSRDPATIQFQIRNSQEVKRKGSADQAVFEEQVTYVITGNDFLPTGVPHIFSDGTSEIPPDLFDVTIDMNYIGSTLRITGLVMSGIIISFSLSFMGWTFSHRNERVVKASQPIFLIFVCIGTLFMGASIIPLSLDDEVISQKGKDMACMAVPWLFVTGFGIAFSALFAKTWRINKLFNSPAMRRVKVTARDVMAPLLIVLAGKDRNQKIS
jgi:hypothetical protein